jgi:two-component system NarL family sensor kinase
MSSQPSAVDSDAAIGGTVTSFPNEKLISSARSPGSAAIGGAGEPAAQNDGDSLAAAIRCLLRKDSAELAESQVQLLVGRVVDAMQEGLLICDERGIIVYVNERLCQMLGGSREEFLDRSVTEHFDGMYTRLMEARERDERACYFAAEWRKTTGVACKFKVTADLMDTADGTHVGWYGVLRDFTGRSQAEAALRRSESEARSLSTQLLAAQDEERQRIARELEISVGEALGGVTFGLEACVELINRGEPDAAASLALLSITKIQSALEDVRHISMSLHPSTLDDLGVLATIGWLAREFKGSYRQLNLETSIDVCEEEIPVSAKTAIYRIIQEALNNVLMHAQARNVSLTLRDHGGHFELIIQDDGIGFAPGFAPVQVVAVADGGGVGVASMRERAAATGGCFTLDTEVGRGTTIRVAWPSRFSNSVAPASAHKRQPDNGL